MRVFDKYLAHHGVDLAHVNCFYARVTGHFSKNTAVSASHDENLDCTKENIQHLVLRQWKTQRWPAYFSNWNFNLHARSVAHVMGGEERGTTWQPSEEVSHPASQCSPTSLTLGPHPTTWATICHPLQSRTQTHKIRTSSGKVGVVEKCRLSLLQYCQNPPFESRPRHFRTGLGPHGGTYLLPHISNNGSEE